MAKTIKKHYFGEIDGQKLGLRRKLLGYSTAEASIGIDVSSGTIVRIEANDPSVTYAIKLAYALMIDNLWSTAPDKTELEVAEKQVSLFSPKLKNLLK